MKRITPVSPEKAPSNVQPFYENLKKSFGKIPNIFQNMGNSSSALKAFFALNDAVNETTLSPQLREQIALQVSQANQCQYCLSAHTAIAGKLGLTSEQILQARKGSGLDAKANAILQFTRIAIEKRGKVADADMQNLKNAGVTDQEVLEIILVITLSMFTNYINNITGTEVDFPQAPRLA